MHTAFSATRSALARGLFRRSSRALTVRAAMVTASKPILVYDLDGSTAKKPNAGSCPYAQRAILTLEEKKIPYDHRLIDPQAKPQDFLDLFRSVVSNPEHRGTVPAIIDPNNGDFKLAESIPVVEYLDAAYDSGTKLTPSDPKKLAIARLFVEVFNSEVQSNNIAVIRADTKAKVVEAKEKLVKGLKVVDSFLKEHGSTEGGNFVVGTYSIADVLTGPFIQRAVIMLSHYRDFNLTKVAHEEGLDRLAAWIEAYVERPSTRATTADHDKLIQSFSKFVSEIKEE